MHEHRPVPTDMPPERPVSWAIAGTVLVILTGLVLWPVATGVSWAIVLAIATWPVYRWLRRMLQGRDTLAASAMCLLLIVIVLLPLPLILRLVMSEIGPAMNFVTRAANELPPAPLWLRDLPVLGDLWQSAGETIRHGKFDPEVLRSLAGPGTRALLGVGQGLVQALLALLTLFFLYRNGDRYHRQVRAIAVHFLGARVERLIGPVQDALRAVFGGVILAAVAQGLVATLGYVVVGLEAPVLLGVVTAVLAVLSFFSGVVWGGAAIGLLLSGAWLKGTALLIWGVLAVSSVDNVVRALVISGSARLPYFQALVALLGGLAVFGPVGLFIGPALLAVWIVLWPEWVAAGAASLVPAEAGDE
ncbi:MAG: AI-2E family transporter, partial [Candidatus Sericytochromatia bacterium]|nr:AI-2E family transporter [Candidatus Sericytochromatia bacterium]